MTKRFSPDQEWSEATDGATVIATYDFREATVQLQQTPDTQVQWSCDCEAFQRESNPHGDVWCEHITRAAAQRSIERLTRRLA
jgi:hypothetical protein